MSSEPRAGWYEDPSGRASLRYWDGTSWTADVRRTGAAIVERDGSESGPTGHESPWGGPIGAGAPEGRGDPWHWTRGVAGPWILSTAVLALVLVGVLTWAIVGRSSDTVAGGTTGATATSTSARPSDGKRFCDSYAGTYERYTDGVVLPPEIDRVVRQLRTRFPRADAELGGSVNRALAIQADAPRVAWVDVATHCNVAFSSGITIVTR